VLKRWLLYVGSVILGLVAVGALLGAFVVALLYPTLPSLDTLTDYQPRIPLRIVSSEGDLLGEFARNSRAVPGCGTDEAVEATPLSWSGGLFGRPDSS